MRFSTDGAGISVQRRDTRRGGDVDSVVLAASATAELSDPCRCGRRHVYLALAHSDQPQRQVMTESLGVTGKSTARATDGSRVSPPGLLRHVTRQLTPDANRCIQISRRFRLTNSAARSRCTEAVVAQRLCLHDGSLRHTGWDVFSKSAPQSGRRIR